MYLKKRFPVQNLVVVAACLRGLKQMSGALSVHFIGGAYSKDPKDNEDDDARFQDVDIYAIGPDKFLVPAKAKWEEGRVVSHDVKVDCAEKITARPLDDAGNPTLIVTKMDRELVTDPDVFESLAAIVRQRYKEKTGYKPNITEPSPR